MTVATLLVETHPDLAAEWHPTKNVDLDLATLGTFSNKKVWWLHADARGDLHEWQQIIRNRAYEGTGCSTCRGRDPEEDLHPFQIPAPSRSLAVRNPTVAALWNYARNGALTPADVSLRSTRHVWWHCPAGHEWIRAVNDQSATDRQVKPCVSCAGEPTHPRIRTLAEAHPTVAAEWHPTRNGDLTPADVNTTAMEKVWWLGPCGHAWKTSVNTRTRDGSGCAKCRGNGAGDRFAAFAAGNVTSLAAKAPAIAAEWHPVKNGVLTPADVSFGSAKRVWWRCAVGHEWENTVNSRTGRNRGCWCCANPGRVPTVEFLTDHARSLAAVSPHLAAQWHPSKNGLVTPDAIDAKSDQRVWWQCAEGHAWQARPASRVASGSACRSCANKADRIRRADPDRVPSVCDADPEQIIWDATLAEAAAFVAINGRIPSYSSRQATASEKRLGAWLRDQRTAAAGDLSNERRNELAAVFGEDWDQPLKPGRKPRLARAA